MEELLVPQRLGDNRSREQRLQDTAKLVDTTLFRAYMQTRQSLVGPLLRLPNFCDVNVVNEKLLETKRYNDLIDFFFGKRLHREALGLLAKFGKEADNTDIPQQLRGPQRTVTYLQNLPPTMIDLILEFAEWPIKAEPSLGMEVFIADTENAETLPREKVLSFLQNIDPKLAVKYLEYIINELDDGTPEFHQRLIEVYLKSVKDLKGTDTEDKSDLKARLLQFLRTSKHYESWKVLRTIPKDGK